MRAEAFPTDTLYLTRGQFGPQRPDFKAKGRIGIKRRQYCHLFIALKEVPYVEGEQKLGKFVRGLNKERRVKWHAREKAAAQGLKVHPLFITTRQVKRWEYEQQKVALKKKQAKEAAAASRGAAAAGDT